MNKQKLLLLIIYTLGIIAGVVFIAAKSETIILSMTEGSYKYGDLFMLNKVKNFKIELPPAVESKEVPGVDSTTCIYLFGDSYSNVSYGHKPLPVQLAEKLKRKVVYIKSSREGIPYYFPEFYFELKQVDKTQPKIVLIEMVERSILSYYSTRKTFTATETSGSVKSYLHTAGLQIYYRWFLNAEKNYRFLFSNSIYSRGMIEVWNTFFFNAFGQIAKETPRYSVAPPFLFHYEETDTTLSSSFYYPHPDSLVDVIAENIFVMQKRLSNEYNTKFVFLPVPNKYTIHGDIVNNDAYDNFLPRLCAQLEKRGVATVDLYAPFKAAKEILYFPTDTHWNARGLEIAIQKTIMKMSILQNPIF